MPTDRAPVPRSAYRPILTPPRPATDALPPDVRPPTHRHRARWRNPLWIGLAVAATLSLVGHALATWLSPYGLHRDELLYLAMGEHLRFWAMDFPPGIAVVSYVTRTLLGDSLVAIRLPSALAASVLVALAYGSARVFGGRGRACVLAGLAVLANPLFLRAGSLFQPVVFDQLWWTLALLALVRIGTHDDAGTLYRRAGHAHQHREPVWQAWALLGASLGLGLLTKFSIAFIGVGITVAILATSLRRTLRTPWPWMALAMALAIGSPSLVGQIALGWPVIGQMRELRDSQLTHSGPIGFLLGQLVMGPTLVLAAAGLWFLLRDPAARAWRGAGIACAVAFLMLGALGGKSYYIAPIYPVLCGAGAFAFERRVLRRPLARDRRTQRALAWGVVAAYGALTLPLGLPLLPPPMMARYAAPFGAAATGTNTGGHLALPQDYADMLGWPEQAASVATVLDSLPPSQREETVLVAGNYGEAGALEFYGPRLGLPPVVSTAGSFWFFGPGALPGTTVVALGIPPRELQRFFRRVTPAGRVRHAMLPWVVDEERDVPIVIAEDPISTLQDVWPSLKPR